MTTERAWRATRIDEEIHPVDAAAIRDCLFDYFDGFVSVAGEIASAIVHSTVYIEYALLARTRDGWRITGTLWCWAPGHGPRAH